MRSETVTFYIDRQGTKATLFVPDVIRVERASNSSCYIYVRTKDVGADRILVRCDVVTARYLIEWCKS